MEDTNPSEDELFPSWWQVSVLVAGEICPNDACEYSLTLSKDCTLGKCDAVGRWGALGSSLT